jgi:ABC-type phosphate/phosphonate transport system substrate-binding protein
MGTSERDTTLVVGAVAYDPKVVSIWEGFKSWFAKRGLAVDYVLYSNYERLVESLLAGSVDVAWNSPLAWVRARRLASSAGVKVRALAMRDTDCDLHSVIVVRADDDIRGLEDLRGRRIAVGAPDSPQATLLPLATLRSHGLEAGRDFVLRTFDVLGGKHGDHVGGERDAARALASGEVDAACLIEGNYKQFENENLFDPYGTSVVARTELFDHCNFTITSASPEELVGEFNKLLLSMSYDDPEVRPLLDLEGLRAWVPGRTELYEPLEEAVDEAGFYDKAGRITASDYRF